MNQSCVTHGWGGVEGLNIVVCITAEQVNESSRALRMQDLSRYERMKESYRTLLQQCEIRLLHSVQGGKDP